MEQQMLDCINAYPYQNNLAIDYADHWRQAAYLSSINEIPTIDGTNQSGDDTFGLEFAAVQWLNLVTNAEQLFNKLMNSILLTGDEKEQIQRWLCLKQECEECIVDDEAGSCEHRRSLERIEELTEDMEQSSDSMEKSSDSQYESDTESDFDYRHPDFEDKLYGYMERFKDKTDEIIREKLGREECTILASVSHPAAESHCHSSLLQSSISLSHKKGRRKSIHPGSVPIGLPLFSLESEPGCSNETPKQTEMENKMSNSEHKSLSTLEPYKELKLLSTESDAKKNQIKQVLLDLDGVNKRIEELEQTIQIKEQFIKDMIKNSDTRASAKQRFQRKWSKLEEEYLKAKFQLTKAKNTLDSVKKKGGDESISKLKGDVEKFKNLAKHYEKRLTDIELIKNITGESAKKVLELENSLQNSKRQMEKLKKQLRKEEDLKNKLEKELNEDKKKMKTIEQKYNLQVDKVLDENKGETGSGERKKWIAEETERFNIMRESSHKQAKQNQTKRSVDKDIKKKEKQKSQINEKCTKTSQTEDNDSLRQEISSLRDSRLLLLDQRSKLEEKYKKDQLLSSTEERMYLECEETIEAIDATIEYKNELICGRSEEKQPEEGEKKLIDTLMTLSTREMRTLLYKYFTRVIDLRENGRKMEQQLDEVEMESATHLWKIRELTHALQKERLEAEQHIVALQRDHQEKLHLMLRHFAEESSSSGTEASRHWVVARDNEITKLKRENKALRRRLQEMEALMQAAHASRTVMRRRSRSASPDPPLKQLPPPTSSSSGSSKVTRLTRQKNKVIIQFDSNKKKATRHDLLSFGRK